MRFFFLLVLLLIGCGGYGPSSPQVVTNPPERKTHQEMLSKFMGNPAEKKIDWDLAGIWNVSRFGTQDKPGKKGRWEAKWTLAPKVSRILIANELVYDDANGQGEFYLYRNGNSNDLPWHGDMLIWAKPDGAAWYLSVNEQSFGFLMLTGDDDERYMAVRSD